MTEYRGYIAFIPVAFATEGWLRRYLEPGVARVLGSFCHEEAWDKNIRVPGRGHLLILNTAGVSHKAYQVARESGLYVAFARQYLSPELAPVGGFQADTRAVQGATQVIKLADTGHLEREVTFFISLRE